MEQSVVLMIIGGAFVVFSVILFLWGRHERLAYRDQLAQRYDLREFLTNWPPRWWLKTLHLGGTIAIIVGGALLFIGLFIRISD